MSGPWNSRRCLLAWPALLLALLTSATAAPRLHQDEHSNNADDGGDNTLFQGHNGFIMDYDGGDKLGSLAEAPTTTATPSAGDRDRVCDDDGDSHQPLPHSLASHAHLQEVMQSAGVVQGNTEEPDQKMDIIPTGLSHITTLRGHLKVTNRAGHPRVPRSRTTHQSSIRPGNCSVSPSCSARDHRPEQGNRFPCLCDDQCHLYGDCCYDSAAPTPTPQAALTPAHLTCRSLMPSAHRADHDFLRMVYMVDRCPNGTKSQLASMCARSASLSTSDIIYMMDIPFFSNKTGNVYSNVYCARCHHDAPVQTLSISIRCSENLTSPSLLADMTYHPGELRWSKGTGSNDSCLLDVHYPIYVGRSCEKVIDICSRNWPVKEDQHQCSLYNYYVEVGSTLYKNWDCAVCNNVSEEDIKCLSNNIYLLRNKKPLPPPSLMDLFTVRDDCSDNQVWDILRRRCQDVSCGSLFTLQDGECVRNNKTMRKDGTSYLNISCYTRDFNQDYSVMFPNQSIYLNHTEQVYNFGEYEFDNSRIRVCSPEGRWTPIMSVLSAVLISISLLFMLLHIAIFFALPKRRNIPSMNLFSMTCSLFIAEFMYMAFFHLNENYTACVIIGVILYYCLSASFMWMNVMSIDICRTFLSRTYMMKTKSVFIQYSIYAWSVPLAASLVAIIVDQVSLPDSILTPQFGTDVCWFNNKWGLVAFFTFPSGFVILVNMMLYGLSVFNIYKQLKSGEFASSTVRRKHSFTKNKQNNENDRGKVMKSFEIRGKENLSASKSSEKSESPRCKERLRERIQRGIDAHTKQRVRLILYCKLALMMGMTWVFAFISIHTKNLVFEYLFIIFNGLQGTFIFIAFDFKRKVWDELSQKIASRTIFKRVSSRSSSYTKSSELKSSESNYRYRWAFKMRQDGSRRYSAVSQDITRSSQERDESGV